MAIIRSPRGLANLHRFHGVDLVIYCESEPTNPAELSIDAGFWHKVFGALAPGVSYTIRRVGGKQQVLQIADALKDINLPRSICAMDRDFDDLHLEIRDYPYVIYTYGYAVENDLVDPDVLVEAIDNSLPGVVDCAAVRQRLGEMMCDLARNLRNIVVADQLLSLYFLSMIPRRGNEYRRLFDIDGADRPAFVNKERARLELTTMKARRSLGRAIPSPRIDLDVMRRAFGHMLWWLTFRICRNAIRACGNSQPLSEHAFQAATLGALGRALSSGEFGLHQYYRDAVARTLAGATGR